MATTSGAPFHREEGFDLRRDGINAASMPETTVAREVLVKVFHGGLQLTVDGGVGAADLPFDEFIQRFISLQGFPIRPQNAALQHPFIDGGLCNWHRLQRPQYHHFRAVAPRADTGMRR